MIKSPLVTTAWLEDNLQNKHVIILDASMAKVVGKKPIKYDQPTYIPTSKRFDLEKIFCNLASSQANTFPTQTQFSQAAQKLGINTDSIVVLYDNQGIYSSPRAWWIFQAMGFNNAVVLDGGLPQWRLENRATVTELSCESSEQESNEQGNIRGVYQTKLVCDSSYVLKNIPNDNLAIIDARSAPRFSGATDEPRAGVRSGHIPSSVNLPFAEILAQHCFKSAPQLVEIFSKLLTNKNNKKSNEIIFTCGSGITACIIMLAAKIAGYQNTVLYDGSWSDWGSNDALPIEKH